jgi:phage gpG-like protein
VRIELEIHGDVQVRRELLRFAGRQEDASPAFRAVATLLRHSEERQFKTAGKHASGGWAKLKQATIEAKQRARERGEVKYTRAILRATGALMESFTRKSGGEHTEIVQPHQLIFGSQVPYARFHQRGTSDMPQRRPLEVRGQDRTEMVKRVQRYLVTGRVRET